jgi:hypothetical protein
MAVHRRPLVDGPPLELMGPALLLLTMRGVALRLRRRVWTRRRTGVLTGPGRGALLI